MVEFRFLEVFMLSTEGRPGLGITPSFWVCLSHSAVAFLVGVAYLGVVAMTGLVYMAIAIPAA